MENHDKFSISGELPIGFGLSLAADAKAMAAFSAMSDEQKRSAIEGCKGLPTKKDMAAYVHDLGEREHFS